VASSHYNSPQHFSFFNGVIFLESTRRVCDHYFFRHCTPIAPFWHNRPWGSPTRDFCWLSGVRDPNALLYRIIGVGRSRVAFVSFLSLFYFFAYLGVFIISFSKKRVSSCFWVRVSEELCAYGVTTGASISFVHYGSV